LPEIRGPKAKIAIGALLMGAASVSYFRYFAGSDEEQIRKVIERAARAVEVKDGDANPIVQLARVRDALDPLLEQDAHVNVAELPLGARHGRREVAELVTQATIVLRSASVDVHDLEIKLDSNRTTAEVGARKTVRGTWRTGQTRRDERAVNFLLRKDGAWRIQSITVWSPTEAL
jgi:hypothetical protein